MYNTNMNPESNLSPASFFEKISAWLESKGTLFKVIEHPPIDGSASGSSFTSGTLPEQGAKALIMTVGGEKQIMVVLRGTDRVDYKAVRNMTHSRDVRLASTEEVKKVTPLDLGTLPPFGELLGLTTYVDQKLLEQEEIACGTGMTTKTIMISSDDFKEVANPHIGRFARE
jgi:Ala-tRNA(Pro) deacylase